MSTGKIRKRGWGTPRGRPTRLRILVCGFKKIRFNLPAPTVSCGRWDLVP